MDPVTVIVAAIAMGAAAGLKDTASAAIRDAYAGLKALLSRRYGEINVKPVEAKPESTAKRDSLKEDLASAGAGEDDELLERARAIVEAVKATNPGVAASIGVDLDEVRAASLRLRDIKAGTIGVRVRKSEFSGDIDIQGVDATSTRLPKE